MSEWIERQAASLRALSGCAVARWQGIELAIREIGANGLPEWQDVSIPFLQLSRLDLIFSDGSAASFVTYQSFDHWGLYRNDELPPLQLETDEPESIFRSRLLDELPAGEIRNVVVIVNEGDIAEVRFDIQGREVRLWAGEVYEDMDGSLRVVTMDERVLVQVDGRLPQATKT